MKKKVTELYFNSIKVRLKLYDADFVLIIMTYFNSIKVRLKPMRTTSNSTDKTFQFHKGTIKTKHPQT